MLSKTCKPHKCTESKVCYPEPGGLSEEAACERAREEKEALTGLKGSGNSLEKAEARPSRGSRGFRLLLTGITALPPPELQLPPVLPHCPRLSSHPALLREKQGGTRTRGGLFAQGQLLYRMGHASTFIPSPCNLPSLFILGVHFPLTL